MRKLTIVGLIGLGFTASTALAQTADTTSTNGTSFRGFRVEANVGGDRFQALGDHHDRLGFGGTVGFDGQIGDKIVVGPEASYWTTNHGNENCAAGVVGGTVCTKSFQELGAAVRVGYLVTPQFLVFGKGGYVSNEQRKAYSGTATQTGFYNHYHTDGYQVGGGVEYTLPFTPFGKSGAYVSGQYVYSQYNDHTARQPLMAGVRLRFP